MSPRKNLPRVTPGTVLFAITKPVTIGTELTEAKLAMTVRRGELGTTTVNSRVHTATQDRPTHRALKSSAVGSKNSAAAMPKLPPESDDHNHIEGDARIARQGGDENGDGYRNHSRPPEGKTRENVCPNVGEQQCREIPRHEEDKRIEQCEDAQTASGLSEDVVRQAGIAAAKALVAQEQRFTKTGSVQFRDHFSCVHRDYLKSATATP